MVRQSSNGYGGSAAGGDFMASGDRKGDEGGAKTLTDEDIVASPMRTRRSALRTIGTLVVGSVLGVTRSKSAAAATDHDPDDSAGRGMTGGRLPEVTREVTDSDPTDAPGYGRTGVTDNDPNDGAGHGRGNPHSGVTDDDPNDRQGQGRGEGTTDNDPTDAPGHGRGRKLAAKPESR
jgi:hypothetical protein